MPSGVPAYLMQRQDANAHPQPTSPLPPPCPQSSVLGLLTVDSTDAKGCSPAPHPVLWGPASPRLWAPSDFPISWPVSSAAHLETIKTLSSGHWAVSLVP